MTKYKIGSLVIVLGICGIFGLGLQGGWGNGTSQNQEKTALGDSSGESEADGGSKNGGAGSGENGGAGSGENGDAGSGENGDAGSGEAADESTEGSLQMTEKEAEILETLAQAIRNGDYQSAAAKMLDQEALLSELFYEKMNRTKYLYKDGILTEDLNGDGLVLKKANTVYCGELKDGVPYGRGIAFQVVDIGGAPRYDYSSGIWQNGQMNGAGIVGYCYYEGTDEENQAVQKEGVFRHDVMQGQISYSTTNAEGETWHWIMEIDQGKIVIDESWVFEEDRNVYHLLSQEDQEHAYAIEEGETGDVRFQNMIPW